MDIPARAKLQGFGGPSAYFGCFHCVTPGFLIVQKQHVYFPGKPSPDRDSTSIPNDLAEEKHGVCALPAFYSLQREKLPRFDSVKSCAIDIMHGVCWFEIFDFCSDN
jgi:hypothetical protein